MAIKQKALFKNTENFFIFHLFSSRLISNLIYVILAQTQIIKLKAIKHPQISSQIPINRLSPKKDNKFI